MRVNNLHHKIVQTILDQAKYLARSSEIVEVLPTFRFRELGRTRIIPEPNFCSRGRNLIYLSSDLRKRITPDDRDAFETGGGLGPPGLGAERFGTRSLVVIPFCGVKRAPTLAARGQPTLTAVFGSPFLVAA